MSTNTDFPEQSISTEKQILSVTELNNLAKDLLENRFPRIWVEGEISNAAFPASGHIYFSLKDDGAQIRAAMFKGHNRLLTFRPKNGSQIIARGRVSLFAPRGDYQLIIDQMEEAGEGALRRAYEVLKAKLAKEGLFNEETKKALPTLPTQIGVITSPTGAAIRDIISVLKRRFPSISVLIYPVSVQGECSAKEIANAIEKANTHQQCDVLIVGRGGGSLEDLWAFNEEVVARAVYASHIPIVSAVGHQTDFTIIDFVADQRAATPSAAAELLSPDKADWLDSFKGYQRYLSKQIESKISHFQLELSHLIKRFKHPGRRLEELAQRLDDLEARLILSMRQRLVADENNVKVGKAKLLQHNPYPLIQRHLMYTNALFKRLEDSLTNQMQTRQIKFTALTKRLNSVSPLATLQRGYSITQTETGLLIKNTDQVMRGDKIQTQLQSGAVISEIVKIFPHNKPE